MPVQQISVGATGREASSNGKSAPRSKLDKNEGGKAPGKSGSRSSNVSKASNSAKKASQTPATPSTQDICSSGQLAPVEKDTSVKVQAPQKKQEATAVKVGPSAPQTPQKKQVKRRHRRKTSSSASEDTAKQCPPPPGVGSDHSPEKKVEKKRVVRTPGGVRRERQLPTRAQDWEDSPSSEDDGGEAWTEARSWSKEKARRGGRLRSETGGDERATNEVRDEVMDEDKDDVIKDEAMDEVTMDQVMELKSVCSSEEEEEKENRAPPENGQEEGEGGLKQRGSANSSGGSSSASRKRGGGTQRAAAEERESTHGADGEMEHGADGEREHGDDGDREQRVEGSSSSSPPPAEEGEELITKRYQETGAGGGDMSAPTPQDTDDHAHFGENGGTTFPCSDDSEVEVCKICHCEGEEDYPLITPCHCTGSLRFVHQDCLNQWIKSSDTRCCELCKYDFIMDTQLKPLRKWEKLQMSTSERRKIYCSVLFHLIAIGCLLWSIYILVKRTTDEIRIGRTEDWSRISLANYKYAEKGILDWPFWTKLIVVAIGFTSGLIFMYIQCKVYLQLWRRLKAFNRIITVQNCPPRVSTLAAATLANGKHHEAAVEVPLAPVHAPAPDTHTTDSEYSVEAALAPAQTPV